MIEYLSNKCKQKTGMLIYNKNLSVCPVTTHLPITLEPKISKKLVKENSYSSQFLENLKINQLLQLQDLTHTVKVF